MNSTLTTLEKNTNDYRVICERCHKTLFFCGQETGETTSVLCDKCTEVMLDPYTN